MKLIKLDDFKNIVKDVNITLRREIKWKNNDKVRVRVAQDPHII